MSTRIAAGPRRAAPAAIESELDHLWSALPQGAGATSSAGAAARVVMANLVAVGGSDRETARAAGVIGNVIGRHPCRVILVTSEPDMDPPGLAAQVAIICQESETCRWCVCCDQIRLAARGIMADNLPGLAASLLTPDLPAVVWWPKPPFDRKDFMLFAKRATRVIVDSDDYTAGDLRSLAGFVEQSRRLGVAVSDLNWGRLTPYRQLFAQFFDSRECRCHLGMIAALRVEGHEATGRLLAGWLKAQIDKSGLNLPGERIRRVAADPGGPAFLSLEMTCSGGADIFAVARAGDCSLEVRKTLGKQTTRRLITVDCPGEDMLLTDEISLLGRDTVYEAALAAAALL